MKRLIAAILATLMLAAALVSCTPAQTSENKNDPTPSEEASTPSEEESAAPSQEATPSSPEKEPSVVVPSVPAGPADPVEVLSGKTALFLGDSIVHASTWDKEHYSGYGWPGRIKDNYGMAYTKNMGRDGASLSTCRGDNLVYNHMINNYNADTNRKSYDFVVLEGGVNDAWDSIAVGKMVNKTAEETSEAEMDRSTMAGGMEHLLYHAKRLYPEATIIFVFNFKLRNSSPGNCGKMDDYIAVQKEICDKWGIPYCNLYEDADLNAALKVRYNTATASVPDGIHPNSKGYDLIAPVIAQFMADTYVKTHVS